MVRNKMRKYCEEQMRNVIRNEGMDRMERKVLITSPEEYTRTRDTLNQKFAEITNEVKNPFDALLSKINPAQRSTEFKKMEAKINFASESFKFAMDSANRQVKSYNVLLDEKKLMVYHIFNESGNNPFTELLTEARDALSELEALKPRALQLIEEAEANEVATFRAQASATGFFNQHPGRGDIAPNNSRTSLPISSEEDGFIAPSNSRTQSPATQA